MSGREPFRPPPLSLPEGCSKKEGGGDADCNQQGKIDHWKRGAESARLSKEKYKVSVDLE